MFLSLDLLSEYRIQHGAIGPLYVTSSYSTWIFYKRVSGFATDCPCDVWCRGLTTGLLHVGPPFGNRFLNTRWAVGLTYYMWNRQGSHKSHWISTSFCSHDNALLYLYWYLYFILIWPWCILLGYLGSNKAILNLNLKNHSIYLHAYMIHWLTKIITWLFIHCAIKF